MAALELPFSKKFLGYLGDVAYVFIESNEKCEARLLGLVAAPLRRVLRRRLLARVDDRRFLLWRRFLTVPALLGHSRNRQADDHDKGE